MLLCCFSLIMVGGGILTMIRQKVLYINRANWMIFYKKKNSRGFQQNKTNYSESKVLFRPCFLLTVSLYA